VKAPPTINGSEFAAEALVDLPQKTAAETQARMAFRKAFVDGNKCIKNLSFARRQRVEPRLQPFLQIFQDQRDEAYIGDFIFRESFADIFRAKRAEMHNRGPADEGPEENRP